MVPTSLNWLDLDLDRADAKLLKNNTSKHFITEAPRRLEDMQFFFVKTIIIINVLAPSVAHGRSQASGTAMPLQ